MADDDAPAEDGRPYKQAKLYEDHVDQLSDVAKAMSLRARRRITIAEAFDVVCGGVLETAHIQSLTERLDAAKKQKGSKKGRG